MRLAAGQFDRTPCRIRCVIGGRDPPLRHFRPGLRVIAEGLDAHPALDAERGDDAPQDHHDALGQPQAALADCLTRRATVSETLAPLLIQCWRRSALITMACSFSEATGL